MSNTIEGARKGLCPFCVGQAQKDCRQRGWIVHKDREIDERNVVQMSARVEPHPRLVRRI